MWIAIHGVEARLRDGVHQHQSRSLTRSLPGRTARSIWSVTLCWSPGSISGNCCTPSTGDGRSPMLETSDIQHSGFLDRGGTRRSAGAFRSKLASDSRRRVNLLIRLSMATESLPCSETENATRRSCRNRVGALVRTFAALGDDRREGQQVLKEEGRPQKRVGHPRVGDRRLRLGVPATASDRGVGRRGQAGQLDDVSDTTATRQSRRGCPGARPGADRLQTRARRIRHRAALQRGSVCPRGLPHTAPHLAGPGHGPCHSTAPVRAQMHVASRVRRPPHPRPAL